MKGPKGRITVAAMTACLCCAMAGCSGATRLRKISRSDLFSLSFGTAENQIDPAANPAASFDMDMREGIFHISNSAGEKVLRLSSYGDLLALYYDPASTSGPYMVRPLENGQEGGQAGLRAAAGRYAVPLHFVNPTCIATDSRQVLYVADRLEAPESRVFDQNLGVWCDHIVRRFGSQGQELPTLGQEGRGGTPFPPISRICILEDDSAVILSNTADTEMVHRFGKDGQLLSALRLPRAALPVPASLESATVEKGSLRLHPGIDGIMPFIAGKEFMLALKMDYYSESLDPGNGGSPAELSFAGSWMFLIDGASGGTRGNFNVVAADEGSDNPELIGESRQLFFLLGEPRATPPEPEGVAGTKTYTQAARILSLVDHSGKVHARYMLQFPQGTEEIMAIKVTGNMYIYALLKSKDSAKIVWWYFY